MVGNTFLEFIGHIIFSFTRSVAEHSDFDEAERDLELFGYNPLDDKGICCRSGCLYIDETGRRLRERFSEQLRSVRNNSPGFPVAEHFNSTSHSLNDITVEISVLLVVRD